MTKKIFRCAECGGNVRLHAKPGRTRDVRYGISIEIPTDFELPTCDKCDEIYISLEQSEPLDLILEQKFKESILLKADKILFLDIDGVLCTGNIMKFGGTGGVCSTFDPDCVKQLHRIVTTTNCYIVLSSTWRMSNDNYFRLFTSFRLACIGNPDIHVTLSSSVFDKTPILSTSRGIEIQKWIDTNNFQGKFVILDDDSDMVHLKNHLVKTNFETGLTESKADEVIHKFLSETCAY
jgi:hypothetical protein